MRPFGVEGERVSAPKNQNRKKVIRVATKRKDMFKLLGRTLKAA